MRRLGVDRGDGLLDPLLLNARGDPDIVMSRLNDDERGRERPQADPRDLGGDRPLAAGSRLARTPPRGPRI